MNQGNPMEPQPDMPAEAEPDAIAGSTPEPRAALPEPEPMAALPPPASGQPQIAADTVLNACQATLASIGESQTAIASDVTAMALEMSGLARSHLTAAGDSVAAMLCAGSLVDAVEIQLGFARRSLDAFVDGSTRLGEIGFRLANDAAKPLWAQFSVG